MSKWDEKAQDYAQAHHVYEHRDTDSNYHGFRMVVEGARWQREALLADDVIERAAETIFAYSFALPDEGMKRWGSAASEVKQMHRIKARAALTAALGIEGEQ